MRILINIWAILMVLLNCTGNNRKSLNKSSNNSQRVDGEMETSTLVAENNPTQEAYQADEIVDPSQEKDILVEVKAPTDQDSLFNQNLELVNTDRLSPETQIYLKEYGEKLNTLGASLSAIDINNFDELTKQSIRKKVTQLRETLAKAYELLIILADETEPNIFENIFGNIDEIDSILDELTEQKNDKVALKAKIIALIPNIKTKVQEAVNLSTDKGNHR